MNVLQRHQRSTLFISAKKVHLSMSQFFPPSPPLPPTIWLLLMSVAHVPPSFFASPKRKEKAIPSYVVKPTALLQQQILSCSSQMSELESNKAC